ncbi:hypothetical protein GJU39_21050 [Pedobacter petrophilus]|uniref:Uncharacterized protein n=1 Tax=Pedobacter petrophilus TaxID=1908241 RepID=A0A7K0G4D8_9SPHI|nr:hypothetical protein [Pedobacter petrophilus]MRX78571.1 hypothetical protein [Pedobacter petrophilus]
MADRFVDYPKGKEEEWEIGGGISKLPGPLDTTSMALRLSSINRSDDVFMFLKKKVTGLKPNQLYTVKLEIEFASNAPSNMLGVGGAPGENVYLKAGLTPIEPIKVLQEDGYFRLNLDKDSESLSGKDLFYINHIANGTQEATYKLLNRSGEFKGRSNENGEAWIVIGTDSGHEATTTLFYTKVKANVSY